MIIKYIHILYINYFLDHAFLIALNCSVKIIESKLSFFRKILFS